MAKVTKATPQDNIPVKESANKGIPVSDVRSAQEALLASLQAPASEQPEEQEEQTEVEETTPAQAAEAVESVEQEADNPDGLTADDIVGDTQEEQVLEPQTYTVKVDGVDVQVTQDELLAGYSRTADYTRKSQVLAEQRKKADDELAATQQERQRYISQLEQLSSESDKQLDQFKNTDWTKLKSEDINEYMLQRDQYRELQENKRMLEVERNSELQKQQAEAQERWTQELAKQQEIMAKKLPEWNDPTKGPKLKQDIKSYALSKGFTDQEVNAMIDARAVEILNYARMYESLLAAKISKKKSKVVPKVTAPGTPTTKAEIDSEKVKQQRARLKRSGKAADAAKLIEGLMS
tara:strand:+ start:364 stop:1413 length:1050 start_codon:yes stop_codon:yes gene_type:complete